MNIQRLNVTESGNMQWDVKLPSSGRFRSSVFSYQNNECRLDLFNNGTHYCLQMSFSEKCHSFNDPKLVTRFHLTVGLHSFSSFRIELDLSKTTIVHRASVHCLWRRSIGDVNRLIPNDAFSGARHVAFLITVQPDNSPTPIINISKTCLESLSEDLSKCLDQGLNSDVEFLCADQSTKAHSVIVSARSPVIASMLQSDMVEGRTKAIKIPNMEPGIFKQFLRYLYTGKLDEMTFDSAMNLYEAGDQYAVLGLTKLCSNFLMEHLSVQNACEVLVMGDRHSDAHFVDKVVDYMVKNRVPKVFDRWSTFCNDHAMLANKVLNRFCELLK